MECVIEQEIILVDKEYQVVKQYVEQIDRKSIFVVAGKSATKLDIYRQLMNTFQTNEMVVNLFGDFEPNPEYISVEKGIDEYRQSGAEMIVAIGGGSAMDVAKAIELQVASGHLIAIPTTAGTGSESTKFAVIYRDGEKQSLEHERCLPRTVFLDSRVLYSLSEYHRKAPMLDALCHAIESIWSKGSTSESRQYAIDAIKMWMVYKDAYLQNTDVGNEKMLMAANLAGKAINISKTTAGHACSYKLTKLYGIAHGHAVALCIAKIWPYMMDKLEAMSDGNQAKILQERLDIIAEAMGCRNSREAIQLFQTLLGELQITIPSNIREEDIGILKESVNTERLYNHPIEISDEDIEKLYHRILEI